MPELETDDEQWSVASPPFQRAPYHLCPSTPVPPRPATCARFGAGQAEAGRARNRDRAAGRGGPERAGWGRGRGKAGQGGGPERGGAGWGGAARRGAARRGGAGQDKARWGRATGLSGGFTAREHGGAGWAERGGVVRDACERERAAEMRAVWQGGGGAAGEGGAVGESSVTGDSASRKALKPQFA